MATERWLALTALAALAAMGAGCEGYSMESMHPTDVHTVAVKIFASQEFRRELEFDLTGKVDRLIESRAGYKVVHDLQRADTELRGEIISLEERVLTLDARTNQSQEVEVTVTCWIEWKDLKTGKMRTPRQKVIAWGTYAPAIGQDLNSATNDAMSRLAARIVEAMESEW
jgi:hypothetical protein